MLPQHHRRFATWLALCVLVLAALAPGVSRALAFAQGDARALAQVCSVDTGGRDGDAALHALEHCAFCALHADELAPPAAAPAAFAPPGLRDVVPALFLRAPQPLFAWNTAQARAPPLLG